MPSQPEPYPLFVSINAQSYPVDNFRSIFNGDHQFFHQQPSTYKKIKNDPEAFADISQMLLYKETLKTMLDDIMQDSEIQCLIQPENVEPLPFFAQFSIKKRNGIFAESINGNLECHNTATEILSAIYFQNWVESILEQTIHNLIQEAHVGDFDITKDCLMLWMEQDKPDQCV
ncbi:hypothetical protein BC830DRAFT_217553 [Chytriomyces sp. MP71]|nr:hypothetical protein BC830DRAFT_217553 [Chytriomyces sp. MP71]